MPIYEKWNTSKTKLRSTITDPDHLTLSKMDGYLLVVEPPTLNTAINKKGDMTWTDTERSWEVVPLTPTELDANLLSKRGMMSCTPWQFRKAINAKGLRSAVDAIISGASQETIDGWKVATSFERLHPMVIQFGNALDLSDVELDDFFDLAVTL